MQSVTNLTADLGIGSSIRFIEIDYKIISKTIFLLPLIQEGLLSVTSKSMYMKYWLTAYQACPGKKCGKVN